MKVSVRIKEKYALRKLVKQRKQEMTARMEKSLVLNGNRVRNEAVKLLRTRTPGSYMTRYSGSRGKRRVIVSRPGDPPNPDTRTAVKSVLIEVDKRNLSVKVGTNLKYLAGLEFMARKIKRAARPWLRPAWRAWQKRHGAKFLKDMGLVRND